MMSILKKWGYLHNERVCHYKLLSVFIIHQDFSFGGIALKIEFVILCINSLSIYENIFLLGYINISRYVWIYSTVSNGLQS